MLSYNVFIHRTPLHLKKMSSIDTSFLKDELGPVLAKGIADTVCASPEDPIEFLGLWLQHYLQEKEADTKEKNTEEALKVQREVCRNDAVQICDKKRRRIKDLIAFGSFLVGD